MGEVGTTIKQFISQEFVTDGTELTEATNLLEEDIVDSLALFTLIAFIEERFQVKLDPEEVNFENFETLETITKLVESKLT